MRVVKRETNKKYPLAIAHGQISKRVGIAKYRSGCDLLRDTVRTFALANKSTWFY